MTEPVTHDLNTTTGQDARRRELTAMGRDALTRHIRQVSGNPTYTPGRGEKTSTMAGTALHHEVTAWRKTHPAPPTTPTRGKPKARVHRVTLPDGTVETRTSKTRDYTHALVVTTDNHARAARLEQLAEHRQAAADKLDEILRSGDLSQLTRKPTSYSGYGRAHYSSFVPGYESEPWAPGSGAVFDSKTGRGQSPSLPDWKDQEAWDRYAASQAQDLRDSPAKLRQQATRLRAHPQYSHEVVRWSSSAANAGNARREWSMYPDITTRVVPVDTPAG